ncbi:MAG: helix-turn-helix domain-containing protein [Polyangiaceae bacterium]
MTDDDYENWDLTVPQDPALSPPPPPESPRAAIVRDLTEAPAILTVDELADLLRVNRKTLYDALSRGEIPGARRIGVTYRIHRDAVLTWLASGQDRAARSRRIR